MTTPAATTAVPLETLAAIKVALLKNRLDLLVQQFERLASQQGNALAADIFGDLLLSGVWDTSRMEVDCIRNQLEPAHPFDPYLVLERDPIRAVQFYKQAAEGEEECEAKSRAQAKLAYLRKRGLLGLKKDDTLNTNTNYILKPSVKAFLDKNTALSIDTSSSTRPIIVDSKTDLFRRLALRQRNRCIFQIFITLIFALYGFTHSYWSNALLLFGLFTLSICLPLAIFAAIDHYHGYREGKPVCNCPLIVNAYDLSVKHLPLDCRKEGNPFKTTPSYICLSHFIKIVFFWFYSVLATVRVVILVANIRGNLIWLSSMDKWSPKGVFFFTVPLNFLVLALTFVFWDKSITMPNFIGTGMEGNNAIYFIITILISVLAEDYDCKLEVERITNQHGIHSYVKELEEQNRPPEPSVL